MQWFMFGMSGFWAAISVLIALNWAEREVGKSHREAVILETIWFVAAAYYP